MGWVASTCWLQNIEGKGDPMTGRNEIVSTMATTKRLICEVLIMHLITHPTDCLDTHLALSFHDRLIY